jgi:nucleoside-diphosphate-sugar epimerase
VRVLVTGASGLVGDAVAERLGPVADVVGVSRGHADSGAATVAWDMSAGGDPPPALAGPWDAIVHAAADTRWTMSPDEAHRANVASVAALEPLVSERTHVVHVSTAYATGLRGGAESSELSDYRNTYEWSKAAAERLARRLWPRVTIVRPPLIVGRRGDGRAARFAGMFTVLRGIATSVVPAVVAREGAYFDVVPVDDLAGLIADTVADGPAGGVMTIGCGAGAPRVAEALDVMTDTLNDWRAERGLPPFGTPRIVSPQSWDRFLLPFARQHLTSRQMRILDLLANFHPYMALEEPLSTTHTVEDVEPALAASVRFWADRNPRLAAQAARPWRAAA